MQNRSFRFQTSGSVIQLMFKLQSITFLCALHSSSALSSSSYHSEKLPVKIWGISPGALLICVCGGVCLCNNSTAQYLNLLHLQSR